MHTIPSMTASYAQSGVSTQANEFGMRPMQHRVFQQRGEQYLLIKSPPASGKSRALMFVALDKMHNQGVAKTIIAVPEKTIGASFNSTPLTAHGFYWDFTVVPKWNLCNAPGTEDGGKVKSVKAFLNSADTILICTHATFRFAVATYGVEAFDNCLIAIDEFHHVSVDNNNKLGDYLKALIARNKTHMVAMTGSYFRGDAVPVLKPEDEDKFTTVSYTYYEQLNGYTYLKTLNIGYYFYTGSYLDDIMAVLNPNEKTIVHIPNVNSRESTQQKYKEVETIYDSLGTWTGTDDHTGFDLIQTADGKTLKVADLVDDTPHKREKVSIALKDPIQKDNKHHIDIIIALGMAKEGFDWIWCEHALTVGYRSSLTEIVQIIGRATRDAIGKTRTKFTNLIAEPDASENMVTEAINDTLKAISASLLMEQVLAPKFNFKAKKSNNTATDGYDYGDNGYDPEKTNIGINTDTGQIEIEIEGLVEPKSIEAKRICEQDIQDIISPLIQDTKVVERGLFDEHHIPVDTNIVAMAKIIKKKYPNLSDHDQEAVRQQAVATMNVLREMPPEITGYPKTDLSEGVEKAKERLNMALIDGLRQYAMDVRNLKMDLIDKIDPFGDAYAVLAKAMNAETLKQIADIITEKRLHIDEDEARELARRALMFKQERGRVPNINAGDPWEKRMAEGARALLKYTKQNKGKND